MLSEQCGFIFVAIQSIINVNGFSIILISKQSFTPQMNCDVFLEMKMMQISRHFIGLGHSVISKD